VGPHKTQGIITKNNVQKVNVAKMQSGLFLSKSKNSKAGATYALRLLKLSKPEHKHPEVGGR
jgi:hypothetical protein